MKVYIWMIATTFLLGCQGGWDKDPFVDEAPNVKNGQPIGKQKVALPPLQNVVFIDVDDFYDVEEGVESTISYSVRVNHPSLKFTGFEIQDMEEQLPGALIDKSAEVLTWTPQLNGSNSDTLIERRRVWFAAYLEVDGKVEKVEKKVVFNIRRNIVAPTVVELVGFPSEIAEDDTTFSSTNFEVLVSDPDVSNVNPIVPDLQVVSLKDVSGMNMAGFIRQRREASWDPAAGVFRYPMVINLKNTEFTRTSIFASVGFHAYNRAGFRSATFTQDFKILTSVNPPMMTFSKTPVTFTKGIDSVYEFDVLDPENEGKIEVDFQASCEKMESPAKCSCQQSFPNLRCKVQWTPSEIKDETIEIKASNTIAGRTIFRMRKLTLRAVEPAALRKFIDNGGEF